LFLLALIVIWAMMRQISSDSLIRMPKSVLPAIFDALSNLSQYFVSRASLSAILYLCMKSALLSAAWASSTLAPIEVPERKTWLDKTLWDEDFPLSSPANPMIARANLKVRPTISGVSLKLFCLFPFPFFLSRRVSLRRGRRPRRSSSPFGRPGGILAYLP
jgi:hypothetical protein